MICHQEYEYFRANSFENLTAFGIPFEYQKLLWTCCFYSVYTLCQTEQFSMSSRPWKHEWGW